MDDWALALACSREALARALAKVVPVGWKLGRKLTAEPE
jgi:hypothetical protein